MSGYHSPQVDVAGPAQHERSPGAPAGRLRPGARSGHRSTRLAPLSRPLGLGAAVPHRRGRGRSGPRRPRRSERVRGQRLQRGAAVAVPGVRRTGPIGADLRADLRPAHPHRPGDRHRGDRDQDRDDDFTIDADVAARRRGVEPPGDHLPLLAQQPDRSAGSARARGCGAGGGGVGGRTPGRRRGLWAVLAVVGPVAGRRGAGRWSSPAPTPRPGRRRRCASVT